MKSKIMFGLGDFDDNPVLKFKMSHDTEDVRDDIAKRFFQKHEDLCLISFKAGGSSNDYVEGQIERIGEEYILNHFSEQIRQCAEFILNKKHMEKSFRETIKDDSLIHAHITYEDIKEWKDEYFSDLKICKIKPKF